MTPRTGRRPGDSRTREQIREAALHRFARHGYRGATIRAIAADADVDPALVHHYFGTKRELFSEAVELPFDPPEVFAELLAGDRDELGRELVRIFLATWDASHDRSPLIALLRSAVTDPEAAATVRQHLEREILRPVAEALGTPDAAFRAGLAATQMVGLAFGRYVLAAGPLTDATPGDLVAAVGPTLQRYLLGDLAGPAGARTLPSTLGRSGREPADEDLP